MTDRLILTLGTSPLPAVLSLVKLNPSRVAVITSKAVEPRIVEVGAMAECLGWQGSFETIESVDDAVSAPQLRSAFHRLQPTSFDDLFFGGGTAVMSAVIYNAWRNLAPDPENAGRAWYLGADGRLIRHDGDDPIDALLAEPVDLPGLAELHELTRDTNHQPFARVLSCRGALAEELAGVAAKEKGHERGDAFEGLVSEIAFGLTQLLPEPTSYAVWKNFRGFRRDPLSGEFPSPPMGDPVEVDTVVVRGAIASLISCKTPAGWMDAAYEAQIRCRQVGGELARAALAKPTTPGEDVLSHLQLGAVRIAVFALADLETAATAVDRQEKQTARRSRLGKWLRGEKV